MVVTAEPVSDIDVTAAEMLDALDDDLERESVLLCFAALKDPARDRLIQYGLLDKIGSRHFFPTIIAAVDAYVTEHGVTWPD